MARPIWQVRVQRSVATRSLGAHERMQDKRGSESRATSTELGMLLLGTGTTGTFIPNVGTTRLSCRCDLQPQQAAVGQSGIVLLCAFAAAAAARCPDKNQACAGIPQHHLLFACMHQHLPLCLDALHPLLALPTLHTHYIPAPAGLAAGST